MDKININKNSKRTSLAVPLFFLLAFVVVPLMVQPAAATTYWVNGTVTRADTGAVLSGAVVANSTDATMTDTTGADGYFNISGFAGSETHTLTVTKAGYTTITFTAVITSASVEAGTKNMLVATPLISAITNSGISGTGATVSWTVNHSTVGNRLIYTPDPGRTDNLLYSAWSNSTTSPSFTLSNLVAGQTYYYTAQSYNTVNGTYYDSDTGSVTTTQSGAKSMYRKQQEAVAAVQQQKQQAQANAGFMGTITASNNKPKVVILLILIIVVVGYFVMNGDKSKGSKKGK